MNDERLCQLAEQFSKELRTSDELQTHRVEHQRRSQRAQAILTVERIPVLTEADLRELFFDSDAFGFWHDKEWEFNSRMQSVGLNGLRQALLELVNRAERGLTPDDLKHVWDMRGLGTLLATELLAYRFPTRYWTFSSKVTLPAFQALGDDIKTAMPHGQKSEPYLYLTLESRMAHVRQALATAGITDADNLLADIFLWWVKKQISNPEPVKRYWKISPGEQAWAWDEFRQRNVIAIGWKEAGNLQAIAPQSQEELQATLQQLGEWTGKSLTHAAKQLWAMYHEMQLGDLICAYGQGQILGHGEVVGDYAFQTDDLRYPHRRKVNWLSTEPMSVDRLDSALHEKIQRRQTIIELNQAEFMQIQQGAGTSQVWLFQANPRIYDLEAGLRHHRLNDWQVNRYRNEIHKGDRVVFWKAGENRGIYGLGTIISDLKQRADGDWVVDVQYDGRLQEPILKEALASHPALSKMLILRQQQGTNFRVTPEEWAALQPLLGKIIPPDLDAIDARDSVQPPIPKLVLLSHLRDALTACNLHYTDWQLATFYTALQTKGFVILSGISGTGKTKLAQYFAEMLPQPMRRAEIQEEGTINLTIQPDHLKNSRFIIPQRAILLFDPPPPNVSQEVRVTLSGQTQDCRLSHYSYGRADYLLIYLRGLAAKWLTQNFEVGDTLVLKLDVDENQKLVGLQAMTEIEYSEQAKQTGPTQPVDAPRNCLFVPVRPDWRDSKSLLGYFNPLTGTYEWTPFLRFLLRAAQSYREKDGLAWFVILDEMNLAHVEYYFADLLSVLESGREKDGWTREPLRLLYPDEAEGDLPLRELRLPPNLYIVGTVNMDETTHTFSPKVLDRAFTLELTEADFSTYLTQPLEENAELGDTERQTLLRNFTFDGRFTGCGYVDKQSIAEHLSNHPQVRTRLQTLNDLLRPYDLHFGYRVLDEILWFLDAAESNELFADLGGYEAALDAAALMKVLPKFHGSRGKLEAPLRAVLAWCVDPDAPAQDAIADALRQIEAGDDVGDVLSRITFRYPVTAERARRMLRALYTDGFAAFG